MQMNSEKGLTLGGLISFLVVIGLVFFGVCVVKNHLVQKQIMLLKKCPECKGTKEAKCDLCKGEGYQKCSQCEGSGEVKIYTNVKCQKCFGTGFSLCSRCDRTRYLLQMGNTLVAKGRPLCVQFAPDYIKESRQRVSGHTSCSECGGTGWTKTETSEKQVCPTCKNRQNMKTYLCKKCSGGKKIRCFYCKETGFDLNDPFTRDFLQKGKK